MSKDQVVDYNLRHLSEEQRKKIELKAAKERDLT